MFRILTNEVLDKVMGKKCNTSEDKLHLEFLSKVYC